MFSCVKVYRNSLCYALNSVLVYLHAQFAWKQILWRYSDSTVVFKEPFKEHKPCFNLVWGSGGEVRHLPGKRGGDRQVGRMKWDWCCLLEEAHSTQLLGLGDNVLLVCENKMWSHTWLLFLLSHLPWDRMKMTYGSVCKSVCVCVCILLRAGNALLHAKLNWNSEAKRMQTQVAYRFTSQGKMKAWDSSGLTFN